MNKKRAFTLIELLVVIAIIAILAAILFPVFAQAKLAAKKAASLSNVKQITLSNIMYENDYDDYFVMSSQDVYNDGCGTPGNGTGTGHCIFGGAPALDYPLLLLPYIKSLGLFVDPGTGDPQGYFGSGPNALIGNQNAFAQYAYNYESLSPILVLGANAGGWFPPNTAPYQLNGSGRSQTQAAHPATTVMFTAAQNGPEVNVGLPNGALVAGHQFTVPDDDFAITPGTGYQLLEATDRLEIASTDSNMPGWAPTWVKTTPVGELTGVTRALNPYNGAVTGFVDGHAKSLTADALAAGTDFGTSTTTSDGGYGCLVTNVNNFIWTLDGTMNDYGHNSSADVMDPWAA
jgi:prepilin-type N-terminal cleavage/methylation domain-containing protein